MKHQLKILVLRSKNGLTTLCDHLVHSCGCLIIMTWKTILDIAVCFTPHRWLQRCQPLHLLHSYHEHMLHHWFIKCCNSLREIHEGLKKLISRSWHWLVCFICLYISIYVFHKSTDLGFWTWMMIRRKNWFHKRKQSAIFLILYALQGRDLLWLSHSQNNPEVSFTSSGEHIYDWHVAVYA